MPEIEKEKPGPERLREKAEQAIGWPDLLKKLSELAMSAPGKARCLDPVLAGKAAAADVFLTETAEMTGLLERGEDPPAEYFDDVKPSVESARAQGVLTPEELVKINVLLDLSARTMEFYSSHGTGGRLSEWAELIQDETQLRKKLSRSFDPDGTVLDTASPELGSLRKSHRVLKDRIHRRLNEIVSRSGDDSLQDRFYTQRGGRYVVPVKSSEKQKFDGIVHDASSSGQTVFVEPSELVENNNRLRLIEAEMEAEIERILRDLSARVGEAGDVILGNQNALTHLDEVRAKARLAGRLDATRPLVNDDEEVHIKHGRHPLLVLREHTVVPNDVIMGGDDRVLIISGPNTGGKSVCLTMVGLFALMARAGMFVPAAPDSRVGVFNEVYAVVGDEQDIALDLSSFSAHMLDIVGILEAAGKGSLVLLDELMSSTDPEEGSALAAAVLSGLMDRGAVVAATTHLPALKSFAHETDGFVNASFTFDPDTLEPSYKLLMGVPGRSLGIDIAGRLGLDPDILGRARSELDESTKRMESLLSELSQKLSDMEVERSELEVARRKAKEMAEDYRLLRDKAKDKESEIRRSAKAMIRESVRKAEDELEKIVAPVKRRESATRDQVLSGREKLRQFKKRTDTELTEEVEEGGAPDWSKLKKGDKVIVMPLGVDAEMVETPEGPIGDNTKVLVKIGKIKSRVEAEKIRLKKTEEDEPKVTLEKPKKRKEPPEKKPPTRPTTQSAEDAAVLPPSKANSLDLRGQRAYEAEAMVDTFLDDSCREHISNVFIIHGHGTGALRNLVREKLAESPYVESFRPGKRDEGGDGVTMAMLKDWGWE